VIQDYPIQVCCSHRTERCQFDFARKAMQMLPNDGSTAFGPDVHGLIIVGETELALERPLRRLVDVYGDMVRIGAPTVRYRQGEDGEYMEQPIMGLRVLCPPRAYEAIREDLRLRQAAIMDAEVNQRFGIARATAPLARLLGYPQRFAGLTDGRGQLVMWLSHYERLEDPPPAGVAA
jgi:predicted membrane GTPase involved in stress response